jgi:hypothetical protein
MTILQDLNQLINQNQKQDTQTLMQPQAQPSWVQDMIAQRQSSTQGKTDRHPIGFNFQRDPFDPSSYYNQLGQIKNFSTAATTVSQVMAQNHANKIAQANQDALANALNGINPQFTYGNNDVNTSGASHHYKLKGVASDVSAAADYWGSKYGIKTIYGLGPGSVPGSDHPKGLATDFMINNIKNGHNVGQSLANNIISSYKQWNVKYVIWNRYIWSPSRGWRRYHGPSPHTDHVHVSYNS